MADVIADQNIDDAKPLDNLVNKDYTQIDSDCSAPSDPVQKYSPASQNSQTDDQPITGHDGQLQDTDVKIEDEGVKIVPDGGYGWFIVLGSFLTHVLMGGFERSSGVMYLQLLEEFGKSAVETSWVLAIFSTLRLCMGPVASALCNKFSIRFVVILGAVLSTAGILISAYTPNLRFLMFSYGVLAGCGRALTYCPCLIIVGYYFNKRRGIAVGLSTSGVGIGSFLFPPMIEKMFDHYGFQGTFMILAGIIFNFMISGALYRPLELHQHILENERKRAKSKQLSENCDSDKRLLNGNAVTMEIKDQNLLSVQNAVKMSSSMDITANAKIMARRPSLFQRKYSQVKLAFKGNSTVKKEKRPILEFSLFKNYAFTVLCLQLFMFTLSFHATFVFLPAIAKDQGLSDIEGAYLLSILGICDALARVVMSIVLDLKRVKKYRLIIYNIVMVVVGVVSLVIPSARQFWEFAIVSGTYGLLSGTYISQKSVVVVDVLGVEKLSSSFGFLLLFQGFGSLLGPIIGAIFKDFLGTYNMSFYFGSIGIFLGGVTMATGNVWLYLQRSKKAKADNMDYSESKY